MQRRHFFQGSMAGVALSTLITQMPCGPMTGEAIDALIANINWNEVLPSVTALSAAIR